MLPLALILVSLASPAAPRAVPADPRVPAVAGLQDEESKLRADLITKLLGLATWCNDKELFLQRDNVWRSILALDSENAGARQGLRYSRDGQGKWKDPAPREVKDRNATALPEFSKKRSEIVSVWRDQRLALLEKEHGDAAKRAALLEEVLVVDPDDALVHGMRGEALAGGNWVLQETIAGEARRAEFRQRAQKGREGVPEAAKITAEAGDLALAPAWKIGLSSDGMRLFVQTTESEAKDFVLATHAACALAESMCGKPMPLTDGFTVYLLVDPAERDRLLTGLPDATDAEKKGWKASSGFGIPRTASVVLWDKDPKRRIDCFGRHLAASLLFKGFGLSARQGWIFEGLGMYFAPQIVGSRQTCFIPIAAGENAALRGRLFGPKADWFAEADKILKGSTPPKFADLLEKELNAIKLEEMVVAQAFAAYLAEGMPKEFPEILKRIGAGESSVAVLESVTGRPVAELEKRLSRWIGERH